MPGGRLGIKEILLVILVVRGDIARAATVNCGNRGRNNNSNFKSILRPPGQDNLGFCWTIFSMKLGSIQSSLWGRRGLGIKYLPYPPVSF